jgi:hypothetical protein
MLTARIFKLVAGRYTMERAKRGPVVRIVNPRHRHNGKLAVVQWSAAKQHNVRLLRRRPKRARFLYHRRTGRVRATKPAHERFRVAKSSVKRVPRKTAFRGINTWQPETGRLLDAHSGWTRRQIAAKFV